MAGSRGVGCRNCITKGCALYYVIARTRPRCSHATFSLCATYIFTHSLTHTNAIPPPPHLATHLTLTRSLNSQRIPIISLEKTTCVSVFGTTGASPPPCLCPPSAACPATAASRTSASAPSSISASSKPPPPPAAPAENGPQSPPPGLGSSRTRTRTRTREAEEGSEASRPRALPSLRDMTTAPPSSLTLTVCAVPAASPAYRTVISIGGGPPPSVAAISPTAVHRPSRSLPSQLHPLFLPPAPVPPASTPLVAVLPHPLPGKSRVPPLLHNTRITEFATTLCGYASTVVRLLPIPLSAIRSMG